MDDKDKLLQFLKEVEQLAIKHSVSIYPHPPKKQGGTWVATVKFIATRVVTLEVQDSVIGLSDLHE